MVRKINPITIASLCLFIVGAVLLFLTIYSGGKINLGLPMLFLVLGGMFFILVFSLREKYFWSSYLYIPGALLIAFGVIFLLNILTGDWNAWAYAWLFLVTGLGVGMLLTSHDLSWKPIYNLIGWSLTLGGLTLFAIFGAITGGLFIQIMAPILLVAAGLSLRWLHLETILPEPLAKQFHLYRNAPPKNYDLETEHLSVAASIGQSIASTNPNSSEVLVDPLSSREVEVLALIDLGLTNQQIAEKLSVAPSTVKTHINNIYSKLGVQTRVQALQRARKLNLIES